MTEGGKEKEQTIFNISAATDWFKQNIVQAAKRGRQYNINDGRFNNPVPNWSMAISGEDKDFYVVEAPIKFDKNTGFVARSESATISGDASINSSTKFLILKNKINGKVKAALMHIVPGGGAVDEEVGYTKRNNFSGTVFYTDLEGNYINGWVYEKGKITARSKEQVSSEGAFRAPLPGESCETTATDWYERTCIYYDDYSIECSNWMYSHTTYQTVCSDDGGGGGGGPILPDEECNLSDSEALAALSSVSITSSTDGVVSAGAESLPDANGIIRKPVLVKRHNVKYNWMFGFSSTYALIFKGIIFKTTSNSIWKWESLTFDKVEETSGSTPPCFSASTSASVSGPIISSDKKTAEFSASVTTVLVITCLNGYKQDTKTVVISDSYEAEFLF